MSRTPSIHREAQKYVHNFSQKGRNNLENNRKYKESALK
jgi:hypothetical protein